MALAAEWDGVLVIAPGGKLNSIFNILQQGRAKKRLSPFLSFPTLFLCVIINFFHHHPLPQETVLQLRNRGGGRDYDTGPQRRKEEVPKEDWILKEEEIAAKLKEAAKDGKISCAVAQKIANENKVPMKQVGDLLNKLKIKIAQCQLGCF